MDVNKIISNILDGDFKDVEQLIKENPDQVNRKNSKGVTVLMAACEQGNKELITLLTESGADLNIGDEDKKWTALHYAVVNHRTDSVAFLVSSGANVNKQDSEGETPLHWAVEKNYEDVVKVLLNSKENNNLQVNLQDRDGGTALHLASGYGSKDVVELLLQHKDTDVNAVTNHGSTPLHLASFHGRKDVVDFLLQQKGIDVNKVNLKGDTPLHLAVQKCMLCEENEASMELQPCAHTVLCEDCSKTQPERCPKCKTCIESKRRVVCPKCKEKAVKAVVVSFECPKCKEKVEFVECPCKEKAVKAVVVSFKCPKCKEKVEFVECPKCKEKVEFVECPNCKEKAVKMVVVSFECPNCKEKVDSVESVMVEEKHLHRVSQKLAGKWMELGRELGIEQINMKIIMKDYPLDVVEQGFQMLLKWRQSTDPEKRTLQILKAALVRTECYEGLECLLSDSN